MRILELINRENFNDVFKYLDYQERIKQCCKDTIKRKWAYLRHLLEYACGTPFVDLEKIDLTFPNYLEKARNDNKEIPLSPVTIRRNLLEVREFYKWGMLYKPLKYKKVKITWLDTLNISRARLNRYGLPDRGYYSLEETLKLCDFSPVTLFDKKDKAAIAMLYPSGMRVSALTSIKLSSIKLGNMTVFQSPSEGVHTKNNKTMETILLPIDPLIEIAKDWYELVYKELGENGLWYPPLSTDGLRFAKQKDIGSIESRNKSLRDGVRRLCNRARIYYRSPHKFRRGHGVYAIKNSSNLEEFDA